MSLLCLPLQGIGKQNNGNIPIFFPWFGLLTNGTVHYSGVIMVAMVSPITRPHDCLLNRLCRRRSKKRSRLGVTGLCEGNSPVTGEFPAQGASNAENVSIWWRHHIISDSYIRLHSPWHCIYHFCWFTNLENFYTATNHSINCHCYCAVYYTLWTKKQGNHRQ